MIDSKQLREIRRKAGLTQADLARLSGLSRSQIVKIERGGTEVIARLRPPTIRAIDTAIARAIQGLEQHNSMILQFLES
jgi:transcriptional regulator with XRE-family HTH domain